MNVRYNSLAHSAERHQTKVKYKAGQVGDLSFELATLKEINGKFEEQCHDCGKKNKKLRKVNDSLSVEVKILEDQVHQVEDAYARMKISRSAKNTLEEVASLKSDKLPLHAFNAQVSSVAPASDPSCKPFGHISTFDASKGKKVAKASAHSRV
nr:hypothetical protein [Tanacetum cinerariifolium]